MAKLASCVTAVLGWCVGYAIVSGAQAPDITAIQTNFAGVWKEDLTKRRVDVNAAVNAAVPMRFRIAADGSLEELRGPENQQNVQPVVFDGKPRDLPSGNAIAWRQLGPGSYERVLSTNGQTVATRRLTVSEDGKTLTEEVEMSGAGGRSTSKSVYDRPSGEGRSLVGFWKMRTFNVDALRMKVEPVGRNALRISTIGGSTVTAEVNGPPASSSGAGAPKGSTEQLRAVSATALEMISARNGTEIIRTMHELTPDGRSMRVAITTSRGPTGKPATPVEFVLVRE